MWDAYLLSYTLGTLSDVCCVSVCVCVRERERDDGEREGKGKKSLA